MLGLTLTDLIEDYPLLWILLSAEQSREVDARTLGLVLAGHATMPFLAFGVARGFGLPPELTVGFVVLGAVTPELVTPVMTELAHDRWGTIHSSTPPSSC